MAITTQYTTEYNAEQQTPKASLQTIQTMRVHYAPFALPSTSVAGDIGSTVLLRRLPAGVVYLLPFLCRITWTAFGASRTIDIGHNAYTAYDGTTTAASAALFDDDVDVSSAGQAALGSDFTQAITADNGGYKKFTSQGGVDIVLTVAGGTIPTSTLITGYLAYGTPS